MIRVTKAAMHPMRNHRLPGIQPRQSLPHFIHNRRHPPQAQIVGRMVGPTQIRRRS